MSALIISLPVVLAEEYRIDYDQNGNIIYDQESNVYREYNELNQLIRTRLNNASGIVLQEYIYDPLKERIFIKDEFYSNGTLKSSTYYFDDDYVVIQNSSGTFNETYIFQDGILVGYEDTDGKKRYVLPDHEGSAHIVLDESGNVLEENLFSPFAEPLQGVKENKFSYEAKEYDPLVQDYDFHFRKYNPNLRIFMQPDTLIQNVYDTQSLNRYSFERNNPYGRVDPSGHQAEGEVEIPIWIKLWAARRNAEINARLDLNERLTKEYIESHPEINHPCISKDGCGGLPSFEELQKEDLKRNLQVIAEKYSPENILGYVYQDKFFTNKDYLVSIGFNKNIVNKEIKQQLKSGGTNTITLSKSDIPRYMEKLKQDIQNNLFKKIEQKKKEEKQSGNPIVKIIKKITRRR